MSELPPNPRSSTAPDDEVEIELREARVVAERCIVLSTLVRRVWLESSIGTASMDELETEAFDLREWLRTEDLREELTATERDLLARPIGQLDPESIAAAAWQAEGLATLGWALGLTDLLPPAELGDLMVVVRQVPSPWERSASWLSQRELRSEAAIARERERAEIWAWRMGLEPARRAASSQERAEHDAAIREVSQEALAAGLLDSVVNDDFAIDNRPLSAVDPADLDKLTALSEERLCALNWLCGLGESWDTVPLDI
jgi:hypothetical protein